MLPKKLKRDAILEAVLDIRFEPDPNLLPELLLGKFADVQEWKNFRQVRLPMADLPIALRRMNPGFRHQPSIELVSPTGEIAVRVGPDVVNYGRRGVYPGWSIFGVELTSVVDKLYSIFDNAKVTRLGLRYINALRSDFHEVGSIRDTAIKVNISNRELLNQLNINFKSNEKTDLETMSRVASSDLADGSVPENATVIVDIDVYTSPAFSTTDPAAVKNWIEAAHAAEKNSFFDILGPELTEKLKEA